MKITVITVCFNAASTIKKTLDSVAFQTYPSIEHIVIDGDSKDGTLGILKSHEAQFSSLLSEPDNGVYDAMNKGLRLATGDIIGFLNADDVFAHPNVLADIATAFIDENIQAIFGDVEYFPAHNPRKTLRKYRSNKFSPKKLQMGMMPAHPTLYMRRGVYEQYGLFNPDYKIAGDFEFISRVFKIPSISYLYMPEVMVRMQTGGLSNSGIKSSILINREIKKACKENAIPTNSLKLWLRYPLKLPEWLSL
ncbi:glycosyltransferase family 2 protein [Polynucleobacter sp. UB-Tiil-W10]|uniref:glycosyltransferase family 2 protein n=1 Tax=Polynucleobacter sp. UB-Tiil-W10 TaxID=1855648 RepID=UPI001C0C8BEE|nr:glycosyltransferase family 2 protein [Polynucleobacter sp. UB-Tiil-W10]MBU3540808.1 glycosyltransferase [Polynucleobacter sp. UB-Tiil-W10]